MEWCNQVRKSWFYQRLYNERSFSNFINEEKKRIKNIKCRYAWLHRSLTCASGFLQRKLSSDNKKNDKHYRSFHKKNRRLVGFKLRWMAFCFLRLSHSIRVEIMVSFRISGPSVDSSASCACKMFHNDRIWIGFLIGPAQDLIVFF